MNSEQADRNDQYLAAQIDSTRCAPAETEATGADSVGQGTRTARPRQWPSRPRTASPEGCSRCLTV